tara:strand:- start:388 stop:624 length:237 start_codon:yes stop_codon:yes gene_type:complete
MKRHLWSCIIGHKATAQVASHELGITVTCHRRSIKLREGDTLIIVSPRLPRLKEGQYLTQEQIEAAGTDWLMATVLED